jgi:hypothetical protein
MGEFHENNTFARFKAGSFSVLQSNKIIGSWGAGSYPQNLMIVIVYIS